MSRSGELPLPFHFDLGPRPGALYGTHCSPVPFFPFGEPETPRQPERVPPLVSASWLSLASSLASGTVHREPGPFSTRFTVTG